MKKLLLTTIAVLAFSGASFAKTVEVESINFNLVNKKKLMIDCLAEKFKAYVVARAVLFVDANEAENFAYEIYFACMAATFPPTITFTPGTK